MVRRLLPVLILLLVPAAACSKRQAPVVDTPPPSTGTPTQQPPRQETPATEDADARRRAEEATARARAVLEEIVYFDYDESTIRADAQESLARKVPILRANPGVRIRITGHADERGSVEYNLALGMRRATAVREYLTGFGIDAGRFDLNSMGEDQPLDPGSNESAWARNRRAEFTVTAGGANLVVPGT